MYKVWSTCYCSTVVSDYTCYVNEKEWIRLHNDFSTSKMFVRIIKNDKYWICALNSPIQDVPNNSIYVPLWMLSQIDSSGDGEELQVEFMPTEAFDHSEKIVLKALSEIEVYDIQELLSNEFTKLAILQKDTIIQCQDLFFYVMRLEPASVVLCEGDEVTLEFYESPRIVPMPSAPEALEALESLEPLVPLAPLLPLAPVETVRFNPWRNKDFKPYMS